MPKDAQGRRTAGLLLLGKPGFTPQRFLLKNLCVVPTCGANFGHTTASRLLSASFRRFDLHTAAWPRFESRLRELHPYDVPEIVALKTAQVAESYARWVGENII